jgi:small subunit ribosomal protein S18
MRCPFCRSGVAEVDYKDAATLRAYLTDRNEIRRRSKPKYTARWRKTKPTGLCPKHHNQLARAIKRARFMGLLPPGAPPRHFPPPKQIKEVNKR